MSGTDFPPPTISDEGTLLSLEDIYSAAGLTIEVRQDDTDLTYDDPMSKAEIHALMEASRNPAYAESDTWWSAWVGIVSRLEGRPNTVGTMFDFGDPDLNNVPREGVALFYDTLSDQTSSQDELQDGLFRTVAHELGHVFNLHHQDWEGTGFYSDATIMSYSWTDSVRWHFSAASQEHLTNDPIAYVKPGMGGVVFSCVTSEHLTRHQSDPTEGHSTCP